MYLQNLVAKALFLLALGHTVTAKPRSTVNTSSLPFQSTYLFSVEIFLGSPPKQFSTNPITIPGGVIVPEPILHGTVSGPYLNATITSGLATPRVYQNNTVQEPVINLYGVTDDGYPFSVYETGIGSPSAQVTRLIISIGGGSLYSTIRNGFVLAIVNPSANRTMVQVEGYLIENTAGGM